MNIFKNINFTIYNIAHSSKTNAAVHTLSYRKQKKLRKNKENLFTVLDKTNVRGYNSNMNNDEICCCRQCIRSYYVTICRRKG